MGRRIFIVVLVCATLGWMAVLMLTAAWPNPRTPDLSPVGSTQQEFLGHMVLFGILGTLVSYNFCYMKGRRYTLLCVMAASLIGLVWGVITEGYQLYVPAREASFLDVVADVLGAGVGGLFGVGLCRLIRFPAYPIRLFNQRSSNIK